MANGYLIGLDIIVTLQNLFSIRFTTTTTTITGKPSSRTQSRVHDLQKYMMMRKRTTRENVSGEQKYRIVLRYGLVVWFGWVSNALIPIVIYVSFV